MISAKNQFLFVLFLALPIVDVHITLAQLPQPIHFTVTISDTQLASSRRARVFTNVSAGTKRFGKSEGIEHNDLFLTDLGLGQIYYATPDGAGSLALVPNDGVAAVASPGQADVKGDSDSQIIAAFVLPSRLYPTGGTGAGYVSVRFNSSSAAWGDTGAEVNYFDPRNPTTLALGTTGSASIILGGIFDVRTAYGSDTYQGEALLSAGSGLPRPIHFAVTVSVKVVAVTSEFKLTNLVRGRSYTASPNEEGSLTLTPNDGIAAVSSEGRVGFVGRRNAGILVSFYLPQRLYPAGGSGNGYVAVRFDSTSAAWGEAGAETNRFDPREPTPMRLDSAGGTTIMLGGIFQVDSTTAPGTYDGEALVIGVDDVTSVIQQQDADYPKSYQLDQNYPNPFNPTTKIRYGLPQRSTVSLSVFNTLGQQVVFLVHGDQEAGFHEVQFDASTLPSGVYIYRLTAGTFVDTKKLILLR